MSESIRTVHVRIEGRVQGVAYRAWMEREAQRLDLVGWVRNRRDGAVEAVLQGKPDAVETALRRCHDGPPAARVTRVEIIGKGVGVFTAFEVRSTA